MTTAMKYMRWLAWSAYYLFIPESKDFGWYMQKIIRTRKPWKKFRPNLFHSDAGRQWQIWFSDEMSYTVSGLTLKVDAMISEETGQVVGLDIWDESLAAIARR